MRLIEDACGLLLYSFRNSNGGEGRGEMMQGKDCLLSWKILLVKTISVNLMKIFWENFPSLWCREDNEMNSVLKTKTIICVSVHLFIFFFHTVFHTYFLIVFALFHNSLKTHLKKLHLSLIKNFYFLAIPNHYPVKTILEPSSRCVFSCWKPSLPSQGSGQRAAQLYNIYL